MNVVNRVYPKVEQLVPLAQDPAPEPIAMVNLLEFRDRAQYTDGRPDDISGRDAYMRYVAEMGRIVAAAGGPAGLPSSRAKNPGRCPANLEVPTGRPVESA